MSLLSASNYSGISDLGVNSGVQRPQIFKKIFISGVQRTDQDIHTMNSIIKWSEREGGQHQYLINNKKSINFIPMFIKKVREGYDNRVELKYFSWTPDQDTEYPDYARCCYIIAGLGFDEDMKPIPRPEEESKPAFIYFKCDGSKMNNMIQFLYEVNKKCESLEPLSDNEEFEKSNVNWRRFIINVTTGFQETQFGNKDVFVFTPTQELPGEKVVKFMDDCNKMVDDFKKQFDYTTGTVSTPADAAGIQQAIPNSNAQTPVQQPAEKAPVEKINLDNIDLGI